jgi:thiamine pyrophosphokinase
MRDGRLKSFARKAAQEDTPVICADGGGEAARAWGINPRLLVGDMDSISSQTLAYFQNSPEVEIRRLPVEKDETDLEMALYAALEYEAKNITIVGGLGGRLDHTLGNLYLIAAPALVEAGARARLLGEQEEVYLIRGGDQLTIEGQTGELLSLIPLAGEAQGVYTDNLYYPLKGETLFIGPTRGVSNVFTAPQATISLEAGMLLAIHTFK